MLMINRRFTKSIFIELCRYSSFVDFILATNALPGISALLQAGYQGTPRWKRHMVDYLYLNDVAAEALVQTFIEDNPVFIGVALAVANTAKEYSIAQLGNPEKVARRRMFNNRKLVALLSMLRHVRCPDFNFSEFEQYVGKLLPTNGHGDFTSAIIDAVIKENNKETPDVAAVLYNMCADFIDVEVEDKKAAYIKLNYIMQSDPLTSFFDRVVIINLDKRNDRWQAVQQRLSEINWPFKTPERFSAFDGSLMPKPIGWASGDGTWGCLLSHRAILEQAIRDGLDNVLILEDDIFFCEDFEKKVNAFIKSVPADWEQLMLGGQYFERSKVYDVNADVRQVSLCHRAHAYAARGAFMHYAYAKLNSTYGHVDHIMNAYQDRFKVYAPTTFLIGQDGSSSDISGAADAESKFMRDAPDKNTPIFLVKPDATLLNEVIHAGLPLHYGQVNSAGANEALERINSRHGAVPNRRPVMLQELNSWLVSNIWYARSVYPSRYFTILNPKGVLMDAIVEAGKELNLIEIDTIDQIKENITSFPFNETRETLFPDPPVGAHDSAVS